MPDRDSPRQRGSAAVLAGALAVALAMAWSAGSALASEDDENVPLDTKIMRQFLKDLGLQRDGAPIEYRERAPLVVPPSRNLPPPQSADAVSANPAWPNDPDVRQRKLEEAKRKKPGRIVSEVMDAEARPLPRSEIDRVRIPAGTQTATPAPSAEESARPMRPSQLGSKSIFRDMFSSFGGNKGEVGTFTGEPPRESLTAPPAGYQTPSPNQPYGVGPTVERPQAAKPEDRLTGYGR